MCKTNFTTLIHNVEAIDKYAQYKVEPKTKSSGFEIGIGGARRFRYRTTLMPGQPRAPLPSGEAGSSHGQEEGGAIERERRQLERRERRREAAQQMSNPASDERRHVVYALGLWAQPSANSDRRKERVRDISAVFFRQNPACTHRLVPWLTREFRVLLGPEHVQFMIQLVLSLLSKINLDGEEFPEHLQPFLATRTSHFLHELVSFARSPLNMAAYDHSVRYEWPTAGRARDNWDPEATVNHSILPQHLHGSPTPGPSGLSSQEIQERLFHELTATRWDDSPPFLPLPSSPSSPILVHGSDSECDGVGDTAPSIAASPLEASSSNLAAIISSDTSGDTVVGVSSGDGAVGGDGAAVSVGRGEEGGREGEEGDTVVGVSSGDGAVGGDGATVSVGRGEEGGREGEEGDFGTGVASETLSQQPRSLEDGDYPTLEGFGSQSLENTSSSTHPPADTESSASLPSSLITETNKQEEEVDDEKEKEQRNKEDGIEEEEECIVINAESEGEQSPQKRANETFGSIAAGSLETHGTKESSRRKPTATSCPREGRVREVSQSKGQRGETTKGKHRTGETKEKGRSKRSETTDRHKKRDRESTEERHKEKEKGGRESRKYPSKSRRRSISREYRHSRTRHDYSRSSSSDSDREHRDRRKRSRSPRHVDADIEPYCVRDKSHRSRLYSDDYGNAGASSSGRARGEPSSRSGKRRERRRESESLLDARSEKRRVGNRESDGKLKEELSSIDEEIVRHKREVLRAMLRCERLKLLHRQLQGRDLPDDSCSNELGKSPVIDERTPTGEVVKQLAELDRAIADEKRRVLQVMKRIEEDNSAADSS